MAADTSPTQEVETWTIPVCPDCRERVEMAEDGHYHGSETKFRHAEQIKVVPAAALQAEVEKREEVEGEREGWRGKAEHRLHEWKLRAEDAEAAEHDCDEADAARDMWRDRALAAESRIEEGARAALDEAPQLLRDEGDEQGGAG